MNVIFSKADYDLTELLKKNSYRRKKSRQGEGNVSQPRYDMYRFTYIFCGAHFLVAMSAIVLEPLALAGTD